MMYKLFFVLATLSSLCSSQSGKNQKVQRAVALLFPDETNPIKGLRNVRGTVTFEEIRNGVRIKGSIRGLQRRTEYGFHVHEFGDISSNKRNTNIDCLSTGAHYDPLNKRFHAGRNNRRSHLGDLGNIKSDRNGVATFNFVDNFMSLNGAKTNIVGRGVVIHERKDDLKSQPVGDAGGRPSCGIIGVAQQKKGNRLFALGDTIDIDMDDMDMDFDDDDMDFDDMMFDTTDIPLTSTEYDDDVTTSEALESTTEYDDITTSETLESTTEYDDISTIMPSEETEETESDDDEISSNRIGSGFTGCIGQSHTSFLRDSFTDGTRTQTSCGARFGDNWSREQNGPIVSFGAHRFGSQPRYLGATIGEFNNEIGSGERFIIGVAVNQRNAFTMFNLQREEYLCTEFNGDLTRNLQWESNNKSPGCEWFNVPF